MDVTQINQPFSSEMDVTQINQPFMFLAPHAVFIVAQVMSSVNMS